MAIVKKYDGWEAGQKVVFLRDRHKGLSYGIPQGSVGKVVEITVHERGFYVLQVYNQIWEHMSKNGILSFYPDEISLVVGNIQVMPDGEVKNEW